MRKIKQPTKILHRDERTGEFFSTRRFNGKRFFMSSIYDSEDAYKNLQNIINLNEASIFDRVKKQEKSVVDDLSRIQMEFDLWGGGTTLVNLCNDKLSNAFMTAVKGLVYLEPSDKDKYTKVTDFFKINPQPLTKQLVFNDIKYTCSHPIFIVGGEKNNPGYIKLTASDITANQVSISFKLIGSDKILNIYDSYASIDYDLFDKISPYSVMTEKTAIQYYPALVKNAIKLLTECGVVINLAQKKSGVGKVNYEWFKRDYVSLGFVTKTIDPIYNFNSGGNSTLINEAIDYTVPFMEQEFAGKKPFDGENHISEKYYVVIGGNLKFEKQFINSIWWNFTNKSDFVKMRWVDNKTYKEKHALAMPLSTFMNYAAAFILLSVNSKKYDIL